MRAEKKTKSSIIYEQLTNDHKIELNNINYI